MIKNQARQGDVFLIRDNQGTAGEPEQIDGDLILAHGEVTGHAHRIKNKAARAYNRSNQRFLRNATSVDLTHEEHGTITIAPGNYRIVIQRVWTDAEEAVNVVD